MFYIKIFFVLFPDEIYSLSLATSLPTLPFEVFRQLLNSTPLTLEEGSLLRHMCIEVGAIHLVLNCLGIFTHHSQMYQLTGIPTKEAESTNNTSATLKPAALTEAAEQPIGVSDDRSHVYWAKGTGFGTGSTSKSWDVEQALLRQKTEEEHVTVFLQVLSSYINPGDRVAASNPADTMSDDTNTMELPTVFFELLQQSCLIPALSSYLRNDSVLDITRHIPLYRAILQLLRAIALSSQLVALLLPGAHDQGGSMSIAVLLANMKSCVDTYASRLK